MSVITKSFGDIFFGSRADASKRLASTPASKVVVITIQDKDFKAYKNWIAFKSNIEISPAKAKNFVREGIMLNHAKKALFESEDWLESKDICKLAGFSPINPSAQIHKWKKTGKIFSIKHNNVEYYPAYALNPDNGYRPFKEISDVINVFGGIEMNWKLAFWFNAINSYLGGKAPKDVISKDPKAVVNAAIIQAEGIQHG